MLPAVYLLHGCGTSFRDWSNYSDVGAYATKGFILVMVDGACSYYVNAALDSKDKYEDYFVHDLISDAESRFPVLGDRANRAVVGVSMGGFAAVKLALTRPDLFSFAGAISPAVDVPSRSFSAKRWSQSMRFRTTFGPSEAKRAYTVIPSFWSNPGTRPVRHTSTSPLESRSRFCLQFVDS
jgi:S-formylglutathione hydrolase FrmB